MRITDDGYISTEVELPREGSRVEYKFSGCKEDAPGVATYANSGFDFDSPYNPGGDAGNARLGNRSGYWRYIDTPKEEKRDSGAPDALAGPLIEGLEQTCAVAARLLDYQASKIQEQESEIAELKRDLEGLFDERMELQAETGELKARIAEMEILAQKRDSGGPWIESRHAMPNPYNGKYYEVMKDGKNLGKAHVFDNDAGEPGWTLWDNSVPLAEWNIESKGTLWRPTDIIP